MFNKDPSWFGRYIGRAWKLGHPLSLIVAIWVSPLKVEKLGRLVGTWGAQVNRFMKIWVELADIEGDQENWDYPKS